MIRSKCALLFLLLLLTGCATTPTAPEDPFTVVAEPLRVRLQTEPAVPRLGEKVAFIVTVEDMTTGMALEGVEVRPVVRMRMPTMEMNVTLSPTEQVAPGQFRTTAPVEHEGEFRVSVSVRRDGLVTPIAFPPIPIQP
ncbi:MAG: FixH family protein [Ardenticatenales bacterium]|nr:FixH family protein [Ardenticatenales bacterium]